MITSSDGPSLTPEEREEIFEEAERIRNLDPDELANLGANGGCFEGKVQWGITIGDGMCLTWDGEKYAILNMFELGAGTPFAGVGAGGIITNAESSNDLLGNAWCVGGGAGAGWAGSAEVCINYTDDWERPTGIWTVGGSTGPGVGADVHVTAVQTVEVFALSPSTISEPIDRWWERGMRSLICFGRC